MKYDSSGRKVIAAPWDAINDVPSLVQQFAALTDPGQDSYLQWDDSAGSLVWASIPSVANIQIDGGGTDLCLFDIAGRPVSSGTFNVVIAAGAVIRASSTATAALDLSGFPSGSTINILNHGHILGKGGRGGDGGWIGGQGNNLASFQGGTNGSDGGPAIFGPGTGVTVNIDNTDGFIWGGGGGGGGGGGTGGTATGAASGGGGGGGAGGGEGGRGACNIDDGNNAARAGHGANGGANAFGAGGAGGSGTQVGANVTGSGGGTGGGYGANGVIGSTSTVETYDAPPGSGGTAGYAVDKDGGTVNITAGSSSPNVKGTVA